MDEALLNAKLEAAEARTDSKFSQLMGEIRVLSVNISSMNENFVAEDGGLFPAFTPFDLSYTNAQ